MKVNKYTKEEFVELTGLSRQRLSQLLRGYKTKGYSVPPLLIEGEDYERKDIIFKESAIEKVVKAKKY